MKKKRLIKATLRGEVFWRYFETEKSLAEVQRYFMENKQTMPDDCKDISEEMWDVGCQKNVAGEDVVEYCSSAMYPESIEKLMIVDELIVEVPE